MNEVYTRPDGLRYDPNAVMDMPRGAVPKPSDMSHPPRVEQKSGPDLARTLFFAQLPLDPHRLSAQKESPSTKLSSAARRAARIAAGKVKVVDGQLMSKRRVAQLHLKDALVPLMGEKMAKAVVGA